MKRQTFQKATFLALTGLFLALLSVQLYAGHPEICNEALEVIINPFPAAEENCGVGCTTAEIMELAEEYQVQAAQALAINNCVI